MNRGEQEVVEKVKKEQSRVVLDILKNTAGIDLRAEWKAEREKMNEGDMCTCACRPYDDIEYCNSCIKGRGYKILVEGDKIILLRLVQVVTLKPRVDFDCTSEIFN